MPKFKNYRCWLEIDRKVIANNVKLFKSKLDSSTKLLIVVKGDAYGYGIVESSKIAVAEGASYLGVAYLEEAIQLINAGIKKPILLLTQPDISEIQTVIELDIIPTVYNYIFASKLSMIAEKKKKNVKIHVKIDTGFNRLGIKHANAISEIERIYSLPFIQIEGYYTHYASASNKDLIFTKRQLKTFIKITTELENKGMGVMCLHSANSPAFAWLPESKLNLVRLGMAIFGLQPSISRKYPLPIKCGITWKTRVLQVKTVYKGESVGYDNSWCAKRKTRVATIAIGYADGFRLGPKNFGYVLCGDAKAEIIGKVSMSLSTIKIDPKLKVAPGDEVVIIGAQGKLEITPEDIATNTGSSNEEIVTNISKSLPRIYY